MQEYVIENHFFFPIHIFGSFDLSICGIFELLRVFYVTNIVPEFANVFLSVQAQGKMCIDHQ